jgi:hypothetical protein
MFHEEAGAKGAPSLGIRGERLTQMLQPNQLWNYQSDRQVAAAAADEFVSVNLKWMSAFGGKADIERTCLNVRF